MKILLLGATGMLGTECREALKDAHEITAPDSKELNIIRWDAVIDILQKTSPDLVINCAAFTDVDACESNDEMIRKINVEGPRNLAQGCARFHCKFIHISSDYIFDGQKLMPQPYFEDDTPNPLSRYGQYKMESEVAVTDNSPNYVIIRTGWLYSVHGKNFVKSIISQALSKKGQGLKVADDQFGSPTWCHRLALQIKELIEKDGRGTYHATAEGYCSRFEWAKFILDKLEIKATIEPCKMKDFPQKAKRPANCVLENRNLKEQGFNIMRDWKEDMEAFLEEFGDELIKQVQS